jgi:hypothetical protein
MKNKLIIILVATTIVALVSGCSKKLEEKPYTVFSPEYFKTAGGFQAGINTLYSGFRFLYGPEGAVGLSTVGTDEYTYAEQPRNGAGGTQDYLTLGKYTMDASNGALLTPWNRSFNNINLANALLQYADDVPLPAANKTSLLGEIRFLRSLYYLNLVQYFGAVPLDLGSGELKFNQSPFQGFNRLPTADLLVKNYAAIIEDAIFATQNLPDQRPSNAFKLSKSAAFHLLAKAYLHRAYSAAKQTTDFQNAYTAAMEIINNKTKYGVALQSNFADVFRSGNDYNTEIFYSVERVPGNFGANEIRLFCPTPYTIFTAFADKYNDSRFEGTYRTVYKATQTGGGFTTNSDLNLADTAFVLALTNQIADSLNGVLPAGPRLKPYRVIAPREFYFSGGSIDAAVTRNFYPCISKFEDPNNQSANNEATRPFVVFRLGETYLIAAEAALQSGNGSGAMDLINVLKLRAASRAGLSGSQITDRYNQIKLNTPSQVTLDYILDERTRELCGECTRWPDLAVRGKLVERVTLYNTDAAPGIKPFHVIRPIPQSQMDASIVDNKPQYQNPGY